MFFSIVMTKLNFRLLRRIRIYVIQARTTSSSRPLIRVFPYRTGLKFFIENENLFYVKHLMKFQIDMKDIGKCLAKLNEKQMVFAYRCILVRVLSPLMLVSFFSHLSKLSVIV